MDKLRVRMYNVRFGDAVLITVPDKDPHGSTTTRHILIDVGNVLGGEGGLDAVFKPVVDDIIQTLNGRALDLYVMTHEHLDHVQGLSYANQSIFHGDLRNKLKIQHAWLTASAHEDYYRNNPEAEEQRLRAWRALRSFLNAHPEQETAAIRSLMINNDSVKTRACVKYLSGLANQTSYVHRTIQLNGNHSFREAQFELWAPEENTAIYYGRFRPVALGPWTGESDSKESSPLQLPPAGVDAGAFYNLVEIRKRGLFENILSIDKAANNTSVVFCLKWRGYRLLFPGDAETRSWREMNKRGVLEPVHFLKVSHHGSHNGTPEIKILDKILPKVPPDSRTRYAVVSTYPDVYSGVPDSETITEIQSRCQFHSVREQPDGGHVDVEFSA